MAVSWAGTLSIHFWGLLPRNKIFLGEKFSLFPSLPFSNIATVTARPSSNGHQRNFVAWYKEWNYGTFIDCATYTGQGGHHVSIGPHFSLPL